MQILLIFKRENLSLKNTTKWENAKKRRTASPSEFSRGIVSQGKRECRGEEEFWTFATLGGNMCEVFGGIDLFFGGYYLRRMSFGVESFTRPPSVLLEFGCLIG